MPLDKVDNSNFFIKSTSQAAKIESYNPKSRESDERKSNAAKYMIGATTLAATIAIGIIGHKNNWWKGLKSSSLKETSEVRPQPNIKPDNILQIQEEVTLTAEPETKAEIQNQTRGNRLKNALTSPFRKIKERRKAKKLEREAAERAEQEALIAAEEAEKAEKYRQTKIAAKETLEDWQTRNKGLFQERKYVDDTGEVTQTTREVITQDELVGAEIVEPPKHGEYTLANFGIHEGYCSNPAGQTTWLIRGPHGEVVTPLRAVWFPGQDMEFKDHTWRIRHTYTRNIITCKEHKCTVLSAGFPHSIERSLARFPGVNFVIEGHIPLKDMQEIKKNIVEKGLWKNYKEHEDINAHIAIYNEIINYLNK